MAHRKRIMFILPRMNSGGAERVVSILANHLCNNYDVTLLVIVSNESFYPLDLHIRFISAMFALNRRNKVTRLMSLARNFFQAIYFIRTQVNTIKPHIVFSLLEETDIVTSLALMGMKNRVIHISSERNDPCARSKIMQNILNKVYQHCDYFVCQSESVAEYYSEIPERKKFVIPNPVDFSVYPERVKEGIVKRIVGVGRLKPQKNFSLLIDSFALIASHHADVKLDIYGEGTLRESLQQKIHDLRLDDRITLRGASARVLEEIRDAAVFVMSSDFEGFPNVLVEAIAMGIPVITTDFPTGVAREIVTDQAGLIVQCGDKRGMASAIDMLLSDNALRERIRQNGYRTIQRFECSQVVDTWDNFFKRITVNIGD